MDQQLTFEFVIQKNNRVYRLLLQPQTPWEDLDQVLVEFKQEFDLLRQEAVDREAKKEQEAPAETAPAGA